LPTAALDLLSPERLPHVATSCGLKLVVELPRHCTIAP
jgi:hypothetical protein